MGENFYIQEIYPKEFQFWKETGILDLDDYTPIINSFGDILFTLSDDDYSGDTFVLYYTGGEWGYLEFGWGSCSACDALQGCSTWEEAEELYSQLQDKILRFYKTKDILNYFMNHDWCGEKKTFKYSTWPDFNSTKNNILNSCGLKSLKNGKLFPEDDRRLISYN